MQVTTNLITKYFDLAVATVVDVRVARILEGVDLYVQRQALGERSKETLF